MNRRTINTHWRRLHVRAARRARVNAAYKSMHARAVRQWETTLDRLYADLLEPVNT